MAKDTYYFSHDYNARQDEKIKRLMRKHKCTGYGVYWCLVEDLYNNANALELDFDGIAFDLHEDVKIVESVINDFGLFVISKKEFGSSSIEKRLDERNEKSKKAQKSAFKRWHKHKDDANALQTNCDSNAIKKGKKGKEINKEMDLFLKFREIEFDKLERSIYENLTAIYKIDKPIIYAHKTKFPIQYFDLVEFLAESIESEEWLMNLTTRFGNKRFGKAMVDYVNLLKTNYEYMSFETSFDFRKYFANWFNTKQEKY